MARISVFCILLSLLAGAVLLLVMGRNPLAAYGNFLQGSGLMIKAKYAGGQGMVTDFLNLLDALTPMIFASLAVAVAMKIGMFNIGVSGQMLTAAIFAHMVSARVEASAPLAKLLVILIGILFGALVGALIGWLKYKFNINEVVSSIMLNYIAMYLITFYINTFYVNPVSRQSVPISAAARLTLTSVPLGSWKVCIPLAFPLAILAAFLLRYLLDRTTAGYEIKAVGLSRGAARYAGVNIARNLILTMTLSGALAGLAGVSWFCGHFDSIQPGVVPNLGFDAIAVALLGNNNPIGCIFSSFLITVISQGSVYMSSQQGVESEIANLITAVILIFAACSVFLRDYVNRLQREMEDAS